MRGLDRSQRHSRPKHRQTLRQMSRQPFQRAFRLWRRLRVTGRRRLRRLSRQRQWTRLRLRRHRWINCSLQEQGNVADLAKAQEAAAGASAGANSAFLKQSNDEMNDFKARQAKFQANDDALMKSFLDHKVDPNNYIHNMGTGAKIAAGISMIFGGLGQGLIGGKNPGTEWLNNAINQDIEAQKNEQGKSLNAYQMNRQAMGDDMQAHIMTQNQMLTATQAKIAMASAAAQGPIAKFRGQQAINDLEKQKLQNRYMLSMMGEGQQGGGGGFMSADPAQLVQSMVPKELQPKAYEEIGRAQNVVKNKESILAAFDRATSDTHGPVNSLSSAAYTPGSINALHQMLLPNFKQIDGTVRQAAMDETFHNVTPTPWDTSSRIKEKKKCSSAVDGVRGRE